MHIPCILLHVVSLFMRLEPLFLSMSYIKAKLKNTYWLLITAHKRSGNIDLAYCFNAQNDDTIHTLSDNVWIVTFVCPSPRRITICAIGTSVKDDVLLISGLNIEKTVNLY